MVECKSCGYVGEYNGKPCPRCGAQLKYSVHDATEAVAYARELVASHNYREAAELYEELVAMEIPEAQFDFAEILERGAFVPRDLDRAMDLFLIRALDNDPTAAYRYSRLAARVSDEGARFWLRYSAALGCEEAYPEVARSFSEEGKEELAAYFCYLSAEGGNKDSLAEMALRYYKGNGVEESEAYAKWYLDKFFIPPIYMIKISYKLRSVRAQEPPRPDSSVYGGFLRTLSYEAEKYKLDGAYFHLSALLYELGDSVATLAYGAALIEGVGCEPDVKKGLGVLEQAAAEGNSDAYGYLGAIYIEGELVPHDTEKGVQYLLSAAEHGAADAYELLGDMYRSGDGVERNPTLALEYYEKAGLGGKASGGAKASEMKRKREDFFERGVALYDESPEEAFRSFAISAAMGYRPAEHRLAVCYELGIGTKRDRYAAYYWYNSAAESGEPEAVFDLGRCFAYGIGVAFDYKKAINLFMKAGSENELVRQEIRLLLERKRKKLINALFSRAMRLLYQKKIDIALDILEGLERLGHPRGTYTLGCLLEFGFGVKTDRNRAYMLYERAYKLMFRDPRQSYKLIVLKMVR